MFSNLTKEIFYYSLIPVAIIAVIILVLLIMGKKKSVKYYKYNYSIKVLLSILLALVFSIMLGYTIWVYERVITLNIVSENILFMILLAVLVISLFLSLIIICYKLWKEYDSNDEQKKEFQE